MIIIIMFSLMIKECIQCLYGLFRFYSSITVCIHSSLCIRVGVAD